MDMRLNAKASIIQFRIGPRWVSHKKVPLLLFSLQKKLFFFFNGPAFTHQPLNGLAISGGTFSCGFLRAELQIRIRYELQQIQIPLKIKLFFLDQSY